VGWEKVVCWSTNVAISLKRVKIEEMLLWRAYRKSSTLFQMVPSATSSSPRLGFTTHTKTLIAIISGTAKATHFKFSMHIHRVDQNKSTSKLFGKNIHRYSQRVSKTFMALIYKANNAVIFAKAQLCLFEKSCYMK